MREASRGAWAQLTGRLFFTQWAGLLLLMVLAGVWLQIPDSHSWQFVFSMLSGVLLIVAFCWLLTRTFRALRTCTTGPPHWRGWLLLIGVIALWWLVLRPVTAGRAHEGLWAGYLNSQSPGWLRRIVGYSQLVAWQERIYDCIEWAWGGLLLPIAVEACACGFKAGWLGRAARVYLHWFYWACVLLFGILASEITWGLASWTPAFGLAVQTFSIVARLGAAYTVDVGLWCFLLCLVAYYLNLQDVGAKPVRP